ncbi:hypothetical protein JST56_02360 [Candidatus Dependentiae bacterium]|jgi:hypothetical protein|nr:hypothetical protein [Candidatus Dependentiae bacterium]
MKLFKFFSMRYLILVAVLLGAGLLFFGPQIQANIFGDIVGKIAGKDAQKTVNKATYDVEKGIQKGVKEVEKVGKDAFKELSKLGLPTDPQKLLTLAFSKMPTKQLEKLATKILNILLDQFSDIAKIADIVMRPVNEIMRPIPPIPLFGIPLPPPVPVAVSSIVDILCDFTLSCCIDRTQYDTFAYLKAFHIVTNNKYINTEDKKIIKSREDFDKHKGLIGKTVDLNKLRGISGTVAKEIKKIVGPLVQFLDYIQLQATPLTKPFEQLSKEFRPIPLASFIPIAGPIYNRVIFVFNLKDMKSKFDDLRAVMENGLEPVEKKKLLLGELTSITDLEKNPLTSNCMKVLRTLKAPSNNLCEKIDEMFVDPIARLPWASKTLLTLSLMGINLVGSGIDGVIKEIVEGVAVALTGGTAVTVTGVLTKIINTKMINEFITETFYWSWIRYLQRRITRIDTLIKQAQADGVTVDGDALKKEAQKILEFKQDYQKNSSSQASKDKKNKKQNDLEEHDTSVQAPAQEQSQIELPASELIEALE